MYKSVDSGEIVDKRIGDEKVVYSQEHWYLNLIVLRKEKSI